jgi:hypothetical protein
MTCVECTIDDDCDTTEYCYKGACLLKLDNGQACTASNQCKSDLCDDKGTGLCVECITPIDCPRGEGVTCSDNECCIDTGFICLANDDCCTDNCATNGVDSKCCAALEILCSDGTCGSDIGGKCGTTDDCCEGICDSAGSRTCVECLVDGDCDTTEYCDRNICKPKLLNGEACTGNNECKSDNCAEGICCSSGQINCGDDTCGLGKAASCSIGSDCCSDLCYDDGLGGGAICVDCIPLDGSGCTTTSDCCEGECVSGTCTAAPACAKLGEDCSMTDCCTGLICGRTTSLCEEQPK